ncbi:hypothetical protein [Mycolicibacterium conceptionense]|nr:hypothetical protein [Mycolicibacterium conceptionense]
MTITCAGVFRAVLAAHAYSPDLDVDNPEVPVAIGLIDDNAAEADAA